MHFNWWWERDRSWMSKQESEKTKSQHKFYQLKVMTSSFKCFTSKDFNFYEWMHQYRIIFKHKRIYILFKQIDIATNCTTTYQLDGQSIFICTPLNSMCVRANIAPTMLIRTTFVCAFLCYFVIVVRIHIIPNQTRERERKNKTTSERKCDTNFFIE